MTRGYTRVLVTQSDERLLELVREGHERAFEAIVLRYRRGLLAYCGRLGLSEARGEDVLQQAFLNAWLSLEAGAEVRTLRPWLYRIVHNTAVNAMRSSREELTLDRDEALTALPASEGSDPQSAGAAREALGHVAALPSMQREAILLSAVDGHSHEEVARVLGITSGAVRGLLYRARAALRAAAAALTPESLVSWASGTNARVAPTAGRLAELTGATGGGDMGGVLLKGAAVAGSALLAAGVVLAPLHRHHTHARASRQISSRRTGASTSADTATPGGVHAQARSTGGAQRTGAGSATRSATPIARSGTPLTASTLAPQKASHRVAPAGTAPGVQGAGAPQSMVTASPTPAPAATVAATSTTPTSTGTGTTGAEGGLGGGTSGGSGGGSSGGSETGGGKSESSGDDGSGGSDDGREDDSGGSESAEKAHEASAERAERERELAAERAEREAERAEERREHEEGRDS